jgi:DNA-binding transcriptional MerR regulator
MADQKEKLSAGETASITGVSKDSLRHYERIGLLPSPPRSTGGYRLYSREHVDRVILIQKAVAVGFALRELRDLLGIRDSGGAPCREVRNTLARKRDDVERKLDDLQRFRDELNAILIEWDARLSKTPTGCRSHLLDSLPSRKPSRKT